MGPLVAIGGVMVSHTDLASLQDEIDHLCRDAGFPAGEPFKWSPGPDLWMRDNLIGAARADFYEQVLTAARDRNVEALVVIEETNHAPATGAATPELDVTTMFLERADTEFGQASTKGVVVVDRPGGDRKDEEKFLAECADTLQAGTDYSRTEHTLFVVSAPSKLLRLLQLADVVTSCTTAHIGGETTWAPSTFHHIEPLLCRSWMGSVGGAGVKLHPDFRLANLYHWLLGDQHFRGVTLPLTTRKYATSPDVP